MSNLASNALNKSERKISGEGAVGAGKWSNSFWMKIWLILLKW